jgi:hypothetical protein
VSVEFPTKSEAKAPDDRGKDLIREPATPVSGSALEKIQYNQCVVSRVTASRSRLRRSSGNRRRDLLVQKATGTYFFHRGMWGPAMAGQGIAGLYQLGPTKMNDTALKGLSQLM